MMTLPPEAFLKWWETHPHSYAVTAGEAWLYQRYQDQWKEACRDNSQMHGEQWWQR